MSLFDRIKNLFTQKVSAAVDRVEDPREALELAYRKQLEQLQQVRRSVADVLTSQKRLELEANQLAAGEQRRRAEAEQLLRNNDEGGARRALSQARAIGDQHSRLQSQIADVRDQERSLEELVDRLQARVEAFRSQKESAKAQYVASKAAVKAGEALTGLSAEVQDVGAMIERARAKILDVKARAAAVTELAGRTRDDQALPDSSSAPFSVNAELIDADLAALKSRVALGEPPKT